MGPDEPIHVLHVDDDPEFVDLTATYLERESDRIVVQSAHSAREAEETLADAKIDCIVSDYDMPGLNGIELLERVREAHPELPFVLYTGKGSEEVASDAIAAGVTDYLQKGHGSEQFAILANRIVNAVDGVEAARRAERQRRINTVVREINGALARATTRSEIDEAVCEIITDAEPYLFAWVGEHDTASRTVEPRQRAGVEQAYLEAIEITTDESPTGLGPTGQAVRDRELAVMQNIPEDPQYEPWREAALERGYQSSAAVPLVHDGTLYGVLNVYADRRAAFDEEERRLLSGLGETIAHAYHRVDLQQRHADQYRTLFEEAPVMLVFTRNVDGKPVIDDCNREFADRLGYSIEELRETPLADYYAEESSEELLDDDGYERALAGEFVREQRTLVTQDGEEVLTVLRASPRRDRTGETIGTLALYVDITDERQVQELEWKNELLSTLFDAVPQGVLVEDDAREVLAANQRLFELFEFSGSPEELVGTDCKRLAEQVSDSFENPDQFLERIDELVETRDAVDDEELALADGRTFERSHRPIELPDRDGSLWVYRDVSGEHARRRELRELKERYEAFVEYSSDVITVLDEDGRITYESPAVERILGYEPGQRCGDLVFEYVHPDDRSGVVERFARIVDSDEDMTERVEYRFKHADGSWVWLESIGTDRTDTVIEGHVVNSREVTERKAREQELQRRNERLDEFASVLSHDLRNPLNVAQGRLELASEECDSDHFDPIDRAHERMEALIDDLLTLAREGTAVTDPEPVQLSTTLDDCWRTVETACANLDIDGDGTVLADESRLKQVFENLFRNAVEHGGESVSVTVGVSDDGFYVVDDGPGIPADERDRVFEAGYSSSREGTGFGLSIVKEIVEAHGWEIRVGDTADGGARFDVTGVEFVTE